MISLLGKNPDEFYVPQFGNRMEIERQVEIFYQNIDTLKNDPRWNWCGLCSLVSILKSLGIQHKSLDEIFKDAFDFGVYKIFNGYTIGAYHFEFARFLQQRFGFEAYSVRGLSSEDIAKNVINGKFFIASVTPEIRKFPEKPNKKSGHMILVFGVDMNDNLIFHNSTGFFSNNSQCSVKMDKLSFERYFSGNGIFVTHPA